MDYEGNLGTWRHEFIQIVEQPPVAEEKKEPVE